MRSSDRIASLLSAGWSRVRVVTDHGWLLLPGGLPKVELSPHLVATKWARCAAVKGGSTPDIPTYPWYWNPVLRIASPPGIGAFVANTEYAHGGISLQECVIPDLVVERGEEAVSAAITEISWRGMRCRVTVRTNAAGLCSRSSAELEAGGVQHRGEPPRNWTPTAKRALLSRTTDTKARRPPLSSPTRSGRVLDYKPTTVGEDT